MFLSFLRKCHYTLSLLPFLIWHLISYKSVCVCVGGVPVQQVTELTTLCVCGGDNYVYHKSDWMHLLLIIKLCWEKKTLTFFCLETSEGHDLFICPEIYTCASHVSPSLVPCKSHKLILKTSSYYPSRPLRS